MFVVLALLPAPLWASGGEEPVPGDVRAWFTRDSTLGLIRQGVSDNGVVVTGTLRTGVPHAAFTWTREFLTGQVSDRARSFRWTEEWVAPAYDDDIPVALVWAWRSGGSVTFAHMSTAEDPAQLPRLDDLRPGDVLVKELQIAAWFAVGPDDVVRPLDRAARRVLPAPAPLETYGPEAATRYEGQLQGGESSGGGGGDSGPAGGLVLGVLAGATVATVLAFLLHRKRPGRTA